ncbi:hypothetical protein ACP46_gp38 [Rhizobium phage RHEph06]|uniref:Uncharacterized protein n=2 Tax=Kleczkowskavirus RHEph4 TaxID=1921526 RepID=L7TJM3_9CAUD|nr:hypothetical protein ACP46_gp38 [Rhizobium phage RHEph06]YP_009598479.1 hypothetical protein FDH25_gp37 [Rhizobium phage RHEph04]AGC35799.1 hypothetical protein RHEph05_gp032 [Rhizobium phage RHEph05]QIG69530.1 hypothetical protein EVB80_047 [Rhizobium phage RHph_I36]QIG75404.1 hypothetical protein EVC17_047 [Rhizobium phage RHph_Y1_1]QIG75954.1 hypothetical protein EVC21_047 [Rhizobium phage RHph_Y2_17_2]QXV74916.1 hypothetical protein [Rhizobium phage RHEph26]
MPYVQRDSEGNISWMYLNFGEGYAEEFLPDDSPEVLAFVLSRRPSPYTVSLALMWSRMTDTEAELVQQAIDLLPVRAQNIIAATDAPFSDSDAFGWLRTAIEDATSASRADEIMAWFMVIL